jgi:uncharacterized protein YwgA
MSQLNARLVAQIICDAGGHVMGRTRLQKLTYLLTVTGLAEGLPFAYKHFGPYSEQLATAARDASLLGLIRETENRTAWGGTYSDYVLTAQLQPSASTARQQLARKAASADATELELAATAIFLAKAGYVDPWAETARRKPEKADAGRLDRAKALVRTLQQIETPARFPQIA